MEKIMDLKREKMLLENGVYWLEKEMKANNTKLISSQLYECVKDLIIIETKIKKAAAAKHTA